MLRSLSHSAAVRLIKGQLRVQSAARILGHTQPHITTYRYLSADEKTLRAVCIDFRINSV
jgi:integrase